ncbi:MAG: NADH-quinone oxidoreductase subunit J [Myxococcales bacterium]|nr:NADH-quinone oxidoreductase subunit J [Myxococcales bacterium]
MSFQNLFATIVAAMTLASATLMVLSRNAIHAAFLLLITLLGVAVEFALLSAHFLAVIQVLVYAGAVMVLIVFVLMMMGFGRGGFQGFKSAGALVIPSVGFVILLLGVGGLGSLVGEPLVPGPIASEKSVSAKHSPSSIKPAHPSYAKTQPPFLASKKVLPTNKTEEAFGSVRTVGLYFLTHHALLFELASVLLLMAILGIVVLLREQDHSVAHLPGEES